jgi:hypothetical protein
MAGAFCIETAPKAAVVINEEISESCSNAVVILFMTDLISGSESRT